MPLDRTMTAAMETAGVAPRVEIIDWTAPHPGLLALGNVAFNKEQARALAARITALVRQDPRQRVILSGHSGGTGVAIWTLEALPTDVRVDQLLLLAGAVSPGYDLSKALSHVRGRAYNFYSPGDSVVLSTLTRNFGTIDREMSDACGYRPFVPPLGHNARQYAKLIQFDYNPAWLRLGHDGGHMGSLHRQFTEHVLAPLLLTGVLPEIPLISQTCPVQ